jgi:hypothetical protein
VTPRFASTCDAADDTWVGVEPAASAALSRLAAVIGTPLPVLLVVARSAPAPAPTPTIITTEVANAATNLP